MKKKQLEMFGATPIQLHPEAGRSAPRFWVKRLVVWEKEGVKVREITLRPGLNIVWSPDGGEGVAAEGGETLGHGAGKTLFCRLLRYCLGEKRPGSIELTQAIADAFGQGTVGVEVEIDGASWAVVRSLGHQKWARAAAGVSLDALATSEQVSNGYNEFIATLETRLFASEVTAQIPDRRAWLKVLAWLSRDQECRFGSLVDWRSAASDADSPVRQCSGTELHDTLRVLLKLSDVDEQRRRREIADLDERHAAETARVRRGEEEVVELHDRLCRELHVAADTAPRGPVGVSALRVAARGNHTRVLGITPSNDVEDLSSLREAYQKAKDEVTKADAARDGFARSIFWAERNLSKVRAEVQGTSWHADRAENPYCELCEVPIHRALAEGCRLSHKLPDRAQVERKIEDHRQRLADAEAELRNEQTRLLEAESRIGPLRAIADGRRVVLEEAERRQDARGDLLHAAESLVKSVERLERLGDELLRSQERLDALAVQRERERERAVTERRRVLPALPRLSDVFDAILRAAIHSEARASIGIHGRGTIVPRVMLGGERSTAAIDSLKVVAFDLAAMIASVEGLSHAPAFLVHDSPREADLGEVRYHNLIRFVAALEPSEGDALFQYILTTTTKPPSEMIGGDAHRVTLRGMPATERLLRRDL